MKKHLLFLLLAMSLPLFAQTTYVLPSGTKCTSSVQACDYQVDQLTDGTAAFGLFETSNQYTQFDYKSSPTSVISNADYCYDFAHEITTQVWQPVVDNPDGSATYTMDCYSTDNQTVHVQLHAVINATYITYVTTCGLRVRYQCTKHYWLVDDGSTLAITKPVN